MSTRYPPPIGTKVHQSTGRTGLDDTPIRYTFEVLAYVHDQVVVLFRSTHEVAPKYRVLDVYWWGAVVDNRNSCFAYTLVRTTPAEPTDAQRLARAEELVADAVRLRDQGHYTDSPEWVEWDEKAASR